MQRARPPRPSTSPAAWLQLLIGLFGFGVAVALMIRSGLGLGPWDAFHVGLHHLTGISIGGASIVAGLAIVLGSLRIRVRPGLGTLANMVLIGVFVDLLLPVVPAAVGTPAAVAFHLTGIGLCGLATGFYIAAGLGKGPRDGLMIGLSERTGWPVRRVRTAIELVVLALGWLMGGAIGIGTLLFAFGIGPVTQWGLRVCGVTASPPLSPASGTT
ncbi:MAG: hypothetical protein M3409_09195 [Gemmatimonadota bacterium]|jgi:uncharacterized membrane protein YczE|nr:hypothetical protein [Gemmatimonadota bacterium]